MLHATRTDTREWQPYLSARQHQEVLGAVAVDVVAEREDVDAAVLLVLRGGARGGRRGGVRGVGLWFMVYGLWFMVYGAHSRGCQVGYMGRAGGHQLVWGVISWSLRP
jgi:hypothetical protein